ncbi:MAG: agmatinase [Candidatus Omnitrophica bacterium]|nr:agmatinase [Candidatus Omnitrophota bacterium]
MQHGRRRSYCDEFFTREEKAKIAVLPVPYDRTSTWTKGADKGPFCLLEAFDSLETYDIETQSDVSSRGIFVAEPAGKEEEPGKMVKEVEKRVSSLLSSGKFVVTVGGEHSVSVGAMKAHDSFYGGISILQLDAHADLRDEYEGTPFSHACVMARAGEHSPCIQVGVRSMSGEEKVKKGGRIFFAHDIAGSKEWFREVCGGLSDKVYVTIDLDVLDPSIMPATGTPQPGGLDWYTVLGLLREVARSREVVGFDIVELCPIEGFRAPEVLAAKLLYKFLGYIYLGHRE